MMSTKWLAGWNMPGCMPETEPAEFDDYDDGCNYIVDELNRWHEQETERVGEGIPTHAELSLAKAISELDPNNEMSWWSYGSPIEQYAAGYVFWLHEKELTYAQKEFDKALNVADEFVRVKVYADNGTGESHYFDVSKAVASKLREVLGENES